MHMKMTFLLIYQKEVNMINLAKLMMIFLPIITMYVSAQIKEDNQEKPLIYDETEYSLEPSNQEIKEESLGILIPFKCIKKEDENHG